MSELLWLIGLIVVIGASAYHRVSLKTASTAVGIYLVLLSLFGDFGWFSLLVLWALFAAGAIPLNLPDLRRQLVTDRVFHVFRKLLPSVSQTEQEALDAGSVWWDAELFSGRPDWKKLQAYPKPRLTEEERAFLDGPTQELCRMVDDWDITHNRLDLPPEAWQFIKDKGFLGMIIPKKFGGLGFSALAHSEVVMKLSTRSTTAGVTVMVPNSLGPAELLMHYGTDDQRNHYLPRLARGDEIPCFALTGPYAGSDAGAMNDVGIVCKGEWNGEEVIGLKLTWEKRYITLGPVATLLGLAFKVYDPDRLLGDEIERGITLALIPADTAGVEIGRRHFPLNIPFQNGPNWGKDVFIPLDYVIGGEAMIGRGWMMLMNCLSIGRSISLPASATGAGKLASLTTGAYAAVRQQFKVSVGEFEGVQEALARIGGNAYLMDATRRMTALAVDLGEKPSVLSGIAKYHLTERGRVVIDAAMDVHGGRGICMGPSNYLARAYQGIPVSITVEGANILTRSMIIFGQGALRCHPYLLTEMQAAQNEDRERGKQDFDRALVGHLGFLTSNLFRSLWLGLTDGHLSEAPRDPVVRRHFQRLNRLTAAFALVADTALLLLGGALKRKEFVSGRLGDLLSYSYLASATLKHYQDEGAHREDRPLLEWALADTYYRWQEAMSEVLRNYPSRPLGWLLRVLVFPLGRHYRQPDDRLTRRVAKLLQTPNPARERLVDGCYQSQDPNDPIGRVEYALRKTLATAEIEKKIAQARRHGQLDVAFDEDVIEAARAAEIISEADAEAVKEAHAARRAAIMVDDFSTEELLRKQPA
jgi:acyl-CoA dehydrogenase